ncbi:phosphate regulon sensor histidine kinase PhoR [Conservatibacter flavescens]|uniref:histidine kinase n=1 Tax=Conservatibacter flavescens TaxID=28161 RepID=A0A2M8S3F4_9PAST|nr:phosphate regulon sensor histidine kinase PhoR [Conservatibacter flavescens]PJG85692.1 PAS domain-containing sensor histidine kinase [Conservatibacter flavescens]
MKFNISYKSFIIELTLAALIAYLFSLFTNTFANWFIVTLILLLVWHNYSELHLLKLLNPKEEKNTKFSKLENLSPTIAYNKNKTRREKIKSLRLLSKLNRNIQSFSDSIIICSLEGDISWCNNSAQELFDFYWNKKAKKNVLNIIFYPEFKQYFQKENHKRPLVLLTHNQRYIEINLNEYDSETYLLLARDITQIIRLLNARQTFLSNMNHELRTPLTVLQGYLEFLEPEEGNEFQQKALQAMKEQSQRMSNLLQQLTLLAKIETSNNNEHHLVNMSELILSLQKNTALLNVYDQQIRFDIAPDLYVTGDENQLQSAVSNLIYNAIKHAGENAVIHISWQPYENGGRFCVSDNGIGIEEKHLPHLTERFYRVDESRSNQTGGSGLGLAIVKHALEQHNSYLQITSKVGEGSQFAFELKTTKPE